MFCVRVLFGFFNVTSIVSFLDSFCLKICFLLVGVQKERMVPEDMYVLSSDGFILSTPPLKPYPHKPPKCTDCTPLFMKVANKL